MSKVKIGNIDTGIDSDTRGYYVAGDADIKKYVESVFVESRWDCSSWTWAITGEVEYKVKDFVKDHFNFVITTSADEMREKLNLIVEEFEKLDLLYNPDKFTVKPQDKPSWKI